MTTYGYITAGGLGQRQQLRHWNHAIAHGNGQIGIVYALIRHAGSAIGRDDSLSYYASQQRGSPKPEGKEERRAMHGWLVHESTNFLYASE